MASLSIMPSLGATNTSTRSSFDEYRRLQDIANPICIEVNRNQVICNKMKYIFARYGYFFASADALQEIEEETFSLAKSPKLSRQVSFEKEFNPIGKIVVT